jgi:pentapeptide MXKDX repeat protein
MGAFEVGHSPLALIRAFPNDSGGTTIHGLLDGANGSAISRIDFYSSCDPSPANQLHFSLNVPTDENGYFIVDDAPAVSGQFVSATVADLNGSSNCVTLGQNDSWPFAQRLDVLSSPVEVEQYIDKVGQSRWYKFKVEPGSQVFVTLTNLPENYDLTVYKDIKETFAAILAPTQDDLVSLTAEFAGDAFSGDAFSGDAFSGDAFSGDAFSGDAFSGDAFSGDAFSGDAFSGDAFSGDAFSGDAFSGDAFSGDAFSGDAFSGDAFSALIFAGDAFSGDAFSGDAFSAAFSSAQTRSLIGVSAFEGTADEGIFLNTWNNSGDFYVRVRGRNGAFGLEPFHLHVRVQPGSCGSVLPLPDPSSQPPLGPEGNFKTLILYDHSRLGQIEGTDAERAQLLTLLNDLAGVVNGKVIDVSQDGRVRAANQQADANLACPYAKNLVAEAIKDIIDGYRTQQDSQLEYVVIVGGDDVIPFFRYPDNAVLARESNYAPPVRNNTPSQASLKLDYVLSQDAYGAKLDLSLNNSAYPVPELAVGRLVETAAEMKAVIDAFLSAGGVVTPQSTLVTAYDFLADAGQAIQVELRDGINGDDNTSPALITQGLPGDQEPDWTAQDVRDKLLCAGCDRDLVFLAGHFTGNSALAADYATRLSSQEVVDSGLDMANNIIFSVGCHAGYNIVNRDGVPFVTRQPDWAQAFASRGATLVAGTGYQYGDTDFLEYSERIYLEFAKQLRVDDSGNRRPVSIGDALVAAKQSYLAQTPQIRGLHEKALLEATIYGLPMLGVNMPNRVAAPAPPPSQAPPLNAFITNPGQALGLRYGDITVTSPLNPVSVPLNDVQDGSSVEASYLEGNNQGVLTNPGEPALPLEARNVTATGMVLRGVGFRGGQYTEQDVIPLIGVAATEIQGVRTPFLTDFFYPVQMWRVNYWDALADPDSGISQLMVTPAQHRTSPIVSTPQKSTRRAFSEMVLRLYYSNHVADLSQTPGVTSIPALAGAPAIIRVSAVPSAGLVTFRMTVVGNPAAGIQEVWVTYTATQGAWYAKWQSLDLIQSSTDSTVWEGSLPLNGTAPQDVRYIVQAANGVGLVSLATNLGQFFTPGVDTLPTLETQLEFQPPPLEGRFGTKANFTARLTQTKDAQGIRLTEPQPLAGELVTFRLGPVTRLAVTDGDGFASAEIALLGLPDPDDPYEVRAAFAGTAELKAAFDTTEFTIVKQNTAISLNLPSASVSPNQDTGMVARLTDETGRPLQEKSVFFVVTGSNGSYSMHQITDLFGRAPLSAVPLGTGIYDVLVYFSGTRTLKTEQGDVTVTLDDASYHPSEAAGSLTINTAPVAQDQPVTTDEDVPVQISLMANDPDGDPLSYSVASGPLSGALSGEAPTLTYIPSPNFVGADSFTFRVNDGLADSNVATVTISVNAVNDAPLAVDDTFDVNEGGTLVVAAPGVLANDSDVDDTLLTTALVGPPAFGTLVLNADGSFTYVPNASFCGMDSYTYSVSDASGSTDMATVTINVACVNQAPVAVDDAYSMDEGGTLDVTAPGVLGNDSDADGDALTAILVAGPLHGALTLNMDGSFSYTPEAGFSGSDSFTYRARDIGNADSNTAAVVITVNQVNRAPDCSTAVADPLTLWPPDKSFGAVSVAEVTDPDGDLVTITITGIFQDEPVGNTEDGHILGPNTAEVRAERDGNGDGRVYHLFFDATDGRGGVCSAEVRAGVMPHDQGGNLDLVDQGPLYDSTAPSN